MVVSQSRSRCGDKSSESPFQVNLSASHSKIFENEVIGSTPRGTTISDWNHYAISFKNGDSGINTKFYVNGVLDQEKELGSTNLTTLEQSGTLAYIATGSDIQHFQLAASMDEFRFWKTERTAQTLAEIGLVRSVVGQTQTLTIPRLEFTTSLMKE